MPRKEGLFVTTFTFEGRRYSASGNTKRQADKAAAAKKLALENGQILVESNMLLKDWIAVCYEKYKAGTVASITLKNERQKAEKWLCRTDIGSMPLKRIKPLHLQEVINEMDGYSDYMIKKILQIMKWVFDKAVENGLIQNNPAQHLTRPKGGKQERRSITETERHYILQVADTDPRFLFYLFMLFCGCRPSEVAEIKGMDIQTIDGEHILHIRGTKTAAADRKVPIPDYLYHRIPKDVEPFDYVIRQTNGKPMSQYARLHLWRRFKRELNIAAGCRIYRNQLIAPFPIADDLVPYCLRHTYCTDLQKQGIDIRTAQYLMGHSSIQLTADIYTHIDDEIIIQTARTMKENRNPVVPLAMAK